MNTDKFQKTLDIAEFAAKRMEDRRSAEFKIFISYITLLVLAFYQVIKVDSIEIPLKYQGWLLISLSVGIHIFYCALQIGISRAMKHDAIRRNYYLRKAEDLSGYPPDYYPDNDDKNKDKIYPVKHFLQLIFYRHFNVIWRNWSCIPLIGIPTLLYTIFIGALCHKSLWWTLVTKRNL